MYIRLLFLLLISLFVPAQSMVQVYPHPETMSEAALKKLHASKSSIESISATTNVQTYMYDIEKIKKQIEEGSFYDLCRILKKQLSYACYCNYRIEWDADTYISEKMVHADQITQVFCHYFAYKTHLSMAFKEGQQLITSVHTYLSILMSLLLKLKSDASSEFYYEEVQAIHNLLEKEQLEPQVCYNKLLELHTSQKFNELWQALGMTQSWASLFEERRKILHLSPEEYMQVMMSIVLTMHSQKDLHYFCTIIEGSARRLKAYQDATTKVYNQLVSLYKSESFNDEMHNIHASAQTWFILFEGYREALGKMPEQISWATTLQPYYLKVQDKVNHLNKTLEKQQQYIQKDILPISDSRQALAYWDHLLAKAYHGLDEVVKNEEHPFALQLKEDDSDSLEGKIKFAWIQGAIPLAHFLNDIGYFPSDANPQPIVQPTLESLRQLLVTFAELFQAHFKSQLFNQKISEKKMGLIKFFHPLRTSKPIPVYDLITVAKEPYLQPPTLLSVPTSTVTPGASFTLSHSERNTPSGMVTLQRYDSDFDTGDAEADKFIIGEYETAHGKRTFEELQKSKLWAENLFNSDKDSQKEINPPNSNAL